MAGKASGAEAHPAHSEEAPPSYEQSTSAAEAGTATTTGEARAGAPTVDPSNVNTTGYRPQEGMKAWEDPARWRETENEPGCLCSSSGGFAMSSHGGVCCSDHGGVLCSDYDGVVCSSKGGVCFSSDEGVCFSSHGGVCCADGRKGGGFCC